MTATAKRTRFRELHAGPGAFVMPNAWDAGSASILQGLGFQAIATSSAASANTLSRLDYGVTRDEAIRLAAQIVQAVTLPVSADLENGFGDRPEDAAETIRLAGAIGLAGGSIEDAPGDAAPYDVTLATERVAAAAEAARQVPGGFVLTARAENFARDRPDLDDTIRRLQAYAAAGADVVFAPGLPNMEAIRATCTAVSKPLSYMCGMKGRSFPVAKLAAAGVKRVSLGTALYRAAITGLLEAAKEIRDRGTFVFVDRVVTTADFAPLLRSGH